MKQNDNQIMSSRFNILELYSGIGGFHFAIKELFKSLNIQNYHITAVDINTTANAIYRHNHTRNVSSDECLSQHVLLERNIQSFSVKELDRLKLDLITMSPPCQPFSRLGLQRDLIDNRCDSFRHLMSTLPLLQNKPKYIMLENVKGFDTSDAHVLLVDTLIKCGYQFEEFLLSPTQFSIPNSRQRYYLIARLSLDSCDKKENVANIHTKVPVTESNESILENGSSVEFVENIKIDNKEIIIGDYRSSIEQYLEPDRSEDLTQFYLNDETLLRYHALFDLVDYNSTGTNCFTKAYAHRIEGCGSILKTAPDAISYHDVYAEVDRLKQASIPTFQKNESIVQSLRTLKLRYFTPREIANLMCFQPEFEFPPTINRKQQYRVLGNSVNVRVCYYLLRILLGLKLSSE